MDGRKTPKQLLSPTPKSLNNIVQKLKKSEATLVFAMTTPPCVGPEKKAKITISKARAQEFNQAALRVMKKHGVVVNDLYVLIENEREKISTGKEQCSLQRSWT
jgi:acyl-CoA thioesterase-1